MEVIIHKTCFSSESEECISLQEGDQKALNKRNQANWRGFKVGETGQERH